MGKREGRGGETVSVRQACVKQGIKKREGVSLSWEVLLSLFFFLESVKANAGGSHRELGGSGGGVKGNAWIFSRACTDGLVFATLKRFCQSPLLPRHTERFAF